MSHDLIGQVQAEADLDTRAQAEKAVLATLGALTARLPAEVSWQLALLLPAHLGLRMFVAPAPAWRGLRTFLRYVCRSEKVSLADAVCHIQAVFRILRATLPAGCLDAIVAGFAAELSGFCKDRPDIVVCGSSEGYLQTFDGCIEGYDPLEGMPLLTPC